MPGKTDVPLARWAARAAYAPLLRAGVRIYEYRPRVLEGPLPTISGQRVAPFLTEGAEGFSVDYPDDFERAEAMIASGVVQLPRPEIRATA